jgi:acylphosphatase
MSELICQVMIRGRVQGVGYRAFVEATALELGLRGWVRNRRDGSVEALFAGPAATVETMLTRCRRGPSAARVEAVVEEPAHHDTLKHVRPGELFSVLPTL